MRRQKFRMPTYAPAAQAIIAVRYRREIAQGPSGRLVDDSLAGLAQRYEEIAKAIAAAEFDWQRQRNEADLLGLKGDVVRLGYDWGAFEMACASVDEVAA